MSFKTTLIENLGKYFGNVKGIAYETKGVFSLDGEVITVDNGCTNSYLRYGNNSFKYDDNGDGCLKVVQRSTPLVFIAAVRNGIQTGMLQAIEAIIGVEKLNEVTFNKDEIAKTEGLKLDRFSDFTLVKCEFELVNNVVLGKECEIVVCSC